MNTAADWYQPLREVRSLGSQSRRPGSLAGLHAVRRENLSQFFTGDDLARVVWELAVARPSADLTRKVSVLDNSVGAGRLLQFAHPDRHIIAGADVHAPSIEAITAAAEAAGFDCDFIHAGMETISPRNYDCAVINPPFSIALDAPTLTPYTCTTWGKYGPSSAANSHVYAVHQALDAARNVVAVVPATYAEQAYAEPTEEMIGRMRAFIELPAGCFAHEGTQVDVALLVFGPVSTTLNPRRIRLDRLDGPLPQLVDMELPDSARPPRPLARAAVAANEPTITGDVTGDPRVRIVHNGRRIGFKFGCALMEAKVLNRVLQAPVSHFEGHRYPAGVRYDGQGKLDMEVILLQPDPMACLSWLEKTVTDMGGAPEMDAGLRNYVAKRVRRHAVESTPFGHFVQGAGMAAEGLATVRNKRMLNPKVWGSPLLKAGDKVEISLRTEGDYLVRSGTAEVVLREDEVRKDFELPQSTTDGWREAHPSRATKFPQLARAIRAQLQAAGSFDVAGWDYQADDMVELLMGRHGFSAWIMGCGKGRLGIGLTLAGGEHNAIVVESRLVDELVMQLQEAGVDESLWQVITTVDQCAALRKINIISYNRLRMPVCEGAGRRTFARLLRRRFATVVADEAHLLRNTETDQSRSLSMLSPRRRFGMSGTPMANYVQNLLPVMQWTYGDGTAVQPYGRHHPFVEARLWNSMSAAGRGTTVFADRHVVTEWVTREWQDGMQVGAKRQVPKISKIELLREWAAPLLKRRHDKEPQVAKYFKTPTPTITPVVLEWDDAHLAHYLTIADEFKNWFRKAYDDANQRGKNMNLIALLARIGAVERACNTPQHVGKSSKVDVPFYGRLTSKQRYVLSRLEKWTAEGHKSIAYVDSPTAVRLYVAELAKRGIEAVPFHGEMTINARTRDMNKRFRFGPAPVLVASKDCVEKGLNLWQASRGILACRDWSFTKEDQMMRRLLRPQQTNEVEFELVCLRGSIDEYQAQMTAMKGDSAGAAIDFLTPETEDMDFVHLDQILNRFVSQLQEAANADSYQAFREQLRMRVAA